MPENLVDTEVMMGQLVANGHELTPDPSVRRDRRQYMQFHRSGEAGIGRHHPRDVEFKNPQCAAVDRRRCLVERYRGDIQKELPEVDAIIGTNELDKIVGLVEA